MKNNRLPLCESSASVRPKQRTCHPNERPVGATKDLKQSLVHDVTARLVKGIAALALALIAAACAHAQSSAATSGTSFQKSIEAFLRSNYALGSDVQITVGPPKEIGSSGLSEVTIDVKSPEGGNSVKMYVTKDGRYLVQGEVSDLTSDLLATNRSKIKTDASPVLGDPNAPITIVEYADFQCPVCRNLHDAMRGILPNYPQVKFIFKDFPLDNLHPWARTAAIAGRCAYMQDPKSFWKMYDTIYDNQEIITASDAYQKMLDYAGKAGLNVDTFKACMASPEAAAAVNANIENGKLLEVNSTPTLFVNGRRLVGADPHAVQRYIDYDLAQLKAAKK